MSTNFRSFLANHNRQFIRKDEIQAANKEVKWDPLTHLRVYLDTIGLNESSLGDDSYALQLVSDNHSMEELTPFYESLYGWIVEMMKSLVSDGPVLEYLREQAHGCFKVKYKCFNKQFNGQFRTFISICKPVSHVLKTLSFSESLSRISPLVDEVAQLMRIYNLNLHPRLDVIIQGCIKAGIPRYKLFTEEFDYVPIYNVAAWKKAGSPKGSSKWSIRIKDLNAAMTIASHEASWYVENYEKGDASKDGDAALLEYVGLSYTHASMEDYDAISSFKASRLYRYIMAVNRNQSKQAEKIIDEVIEINTDFYAILNGLVGSDEDDVSNIGDITELSHSVPV